LLRRGRMQWIVNHDNRSDFTCAANEMELLLYELEETIQSEKYDQSRSDESTISTITYNMVLEAYANCANSRGNYRYADKAYDLILRMPPHRVDARSWLQVIRAWAWQQGNFHDAQCAQRAKDCIQLLQQKVTGDGNDVTILAEAYDWVIEAYSKAIGGAKQADDVFQKRLNLQSICPVPVADYTNVIIAWTKDRKESSIEKATSVLKTMSELFLSNRLHGDPEHIAFSSVIAAWTQLGRPEKAEEILWLMEKDVRPMTISMKPTVFTYNNVCHAYTKDNSKIDSKTLKAVTRIIAYMEENYKEQPLIKPDSYTYNTLIKAWNLSGNLQTVEQIELVLDRMETILCDGTVSNTNFNMVLNTYAKSKDEKSLDNALRLFDRMKTSKLVEPDTITYTTILECLSKKSPNAEWAADKALEIFQELKQLYDSTKKSSLMPNSRTYSMAILAISKSPDKLNQANELLDQLISQYRITKDPTLRPTVHAYNYVINGASNVNDTNDFVGDGSTKIDAFKVAARAYQALRDDSEVKPDSYTYSFWFKACNNLLGESSTNISSSSSSTTTTKASTKRSAVYEKFMKLSFEQCCKEGMVSREVLYRLKQGHFTYPQLSAMLHHSDPRTVMSVTLEDLELAWTRNVLRNEPKGKR
jgi:tetratricopeptide (TPR) repeat protein